MASLCSTAPLLEGDAWFSAAELAAMALPGLARDKRSINARARDGCWAARVNDDGVLLVRKRAGRGGGLEYHLDLLPPEARLELVRRGIVAEQPEKSPEDARAQAWAWFEQQSEAVRDEARRRLEIIQAVETLQQAGATQGAAVSTVSADRAAQSEKCGKSTILGWIKLVRGVDRADRLPALAPRRKGGGVKSEIDEELWQAFKSDVLRLSAPTLTSAYDRTARLAKQRGLSMPSQRTFSRRAKTDIPPEIWVFKREGVEALRRSVPANRRTVIGLHALEWVNIDGHRFDVFVTPPPMSASKKPIRPMMVAIQDVYSRKILSWRMGCDETALLTRLAFADVFENFGIPHHALLDNSRAFWSKWITGGHRGTRFRFKTKEDEPIGLLGGVGVQVHAAKPYHGQSKPIERAFRELADRVAKHPDCEGAYTGNSPMTKPENYGSRAVDWDHFCKLVDLEIAEHNAREGRRTEMAGGRSLDEVFEASYSQVRISQATKHHMRFALLAGEQVRVDRTNGQVKLYGNRYWHPELSKRRGEAVTVRFDPEDLHAPVHAYDHKGAYLCEAELLPDFGFADVAGAKEASRREKNYVRSVREMEAAQDLISAEELSALHQGQAGSQKVSDKLKPGATAPVRHAAAERKTKSIEARNGDILDRMMAAKPKRAANNY